MPSKRKGSQPSLEALMGGKLGSKLKTGSTVKSVDDDRPSNPVAEETPELSAPSLASVSPTSDPLSQWIDGLHRRAGQFEDDPGDDSLPILDPVRGSRIVWELVTGDEGLIVRPRWQLASKTGDGFTQGKALALSRLRADADLPLDDLDHRMISEMTRKSTDDSIPGEDIFSDHLPIGPALRHLMGCDRVVCKGAAVTVHQGLPPIQVGKRLKRKAADSDLGIARGQESDDEGEIGWGAQVLAGNGDPLDAIYLAGCIVIVDHESSKVFFETDDGGRDLVGLIGDLLGSPSIPVDRREAYLKAIAPLQNVVSLVLPKAMAGPVRQTPARMVVLLRCSEDLSLDYGIRFRDAAGRLHRPGEGPMISAARDNGRPFQAMRNFQQEQNRCVRFVQNHRLDADAFSRWIGNFNRLKRTLTFIASVQRQSCDASLSPGRRLEVLWDRSHDTPPIKILGSVSPKNVQVEIETRGNWFGIGGKVSVGDIELSADELLAAINQDDLGLEGDFIQIRGCMWARVDADLKTRLHRIAGTLHQVRGQKQFGPSAAAEICELQSLGVEIAGDEGWQACLKRLSDSRTMTPPIPSNLRAELRDYQVEGYQWMQRLAHQGIGGILADDMGLGKTLQTLAVLLDRAAGGPALVIAPTSVAFNWIREAARFTPDLTVYNYRETSRASFLSSLGKNDVVICSYGLAMRDGEALAKADWHTLVMDEAQAVKNANSRTSQAIATIPADWTIALTGTPVENHLGELWSLFRIVAPEILGGWDHFRAHYAEPIERDQNEEAREKLASRITPFVLRRSKSAVLTELPPRSESNLYVELTVDERSHYEEVRQTALAEIKSLSEQSAVETNDQPKRDENKERFKILAMMTKLRQIACHVGLVDDAWDKSSAKLDRLAEVLEDLRAESHRVLIFSQFTSHLALIRTRLGEMGVTYEYLDGSTPTKEREKAVDRFQNGSADAFLISLKAGGTGLNLTAADYVIHMDPWWNPAVEDQATDRAHRMGQTKPVMVYRMVARRTIEEQILTLHASKRKLIEAVMSGTAAAAKLTTSDLVEMIRDAET